MALSDEQISQLGEQWFFGGLDPTMMAFARAIATAAAEDTRERAASSSDEFIHYREALSIVERACAGEGADNLHYDYQGRNAAFIDGVVGAVRNEREECDPVTERIRLQRAMELSEKRLVNATAKLKKTRTT